MIFPPFFILLYAIIIGVCTIKKAFMMAFQINFQLMILINIIYSSCIFLTFNNDKRE